MEAEQLNTKLEVKKQWMCDFCGEVIESDNDGMLEWDSHLEGKITANKFRIVHSHKEGCKRPKWADVNLADGHLDWFTGAEGLAQLIDIQNRYKVDPVEFGKIIKRIHVDYYEEGRLYVNRAQEDGHEIDLYNLGQLSQNDLKMMIEKYGDK